MKLTLDGKISITRPQDFDGNNEIHVEILDLDAVAVVARVKVVFSEFARALTGEGRIDCTIVTSNEQLALVGMQRETKTVFVRRMGYDKAAEALAPYEVDGWKGRPEDYRNHHNWIVKNGNAGVNVVFTRHVPKKPEEKS